MKGIHRIYGITIAFLALWIVINAQNAPTVCPYPSEEFPENTTTNIAHETICTKYYKCFIGRGVEQDCPFLSKDDPVSRLHYNREKQVCDWPWEAGCHVCPPRVNGRWPDALLPAEDGDCKKYYQCINGKPVVRYCPNDNTCFSRTCQACVVNRAGGYCPWSPLPPPNFTSTSSTTTTSTTTSTPPPCQPLGDRIPHDCNCAFYYECTDVGYILEACYGGLHFSPSRRQCVPPDEANCRLFN